MKGKISVLGSAFAVFFLTFSSQSSAQAIFSRDLSLGMSGSDVKALQIRLNQDPATEVSATGPGSSGNETSYFGPRTAAAVVDFQEKYAADILVPAGLSGGTGYVGPRTRAKLEKLITKENPLPQEQFVGSVSQNAPGSFSHDSVQPASSSIVTTLPLATVSFSTTTKSTSPSSQFVSQSVPQALSARGVVSQQDAFQAVSPDDLLIFGLSHNKIKPGDSLTVTGFGFDPDTVVHIGSSYSADASATSTNGFSFQIPTISYGTYDLWVSNSRGTSMDKSPFKLTIAEATDKRPTIISVSPLVAGMNDTITVTVDRLGFSNNVVYSNIGIIRPLPSSDGETMSFKVSQLPNASEFAQDLSMKEFTVNFGIGTAAGLSLNYGYFTLTK